MDSLSSFYYRKRTFLETLPPSQQAQAEALISQILKLLRAETLSAETLALIVALSHQQGH